jgi:hypothetical protein
VAARFDHHVLGLHIAMNDVLAMSGLQPARHTDPDCRHFGDGQRRAREELAQADPIDQLHRDVEHFIDFADLVYRSDIRMDDGSGGPRFAKEARTASRLTFASLVEHLDRHGAAQSRILRPIDDAHAATTDLALDDESANPRADRMPVRVLGIGIRVLRNHAEEARRVARIGSGHRPSSRSSVVGSLAPLRRAAHACTLSCPMRPPGGILPVTLSGHVPLPSPKPWTHAARVRDSAPTPAAAAATPRRCAGETYSRAVSRCATWSPGVTWRMGTAGPGASAPGSAPEGRRRGAARPGSCRLLLPERVSFWEDDNVQLRDRTLVGGANAESLLRRASAPPPGGRKRPPSAMGAAPRRGGA